MALVNEAAENVKGSRTMVGVTRPTLKGTKTLDLASRDQFVLMDEAAQDVASSNTRHAGNRCVGIRPRVRRLKVDPAVRPLRVVVGDVVAEPARDDADRGRASSQGIHV